MSQNSSTARAITYIYGVNISILIIITCTNKNKEYILTTISIKTVVSKLQDKIGLIFQIN